MVKVINDKEELIKLVYVQHKPGIAMVLSPKEIEQWKKEGKFRHIKNELEILQNMQFSCTKKEDGSCMYYFMFENDELMKRVNMLLRDLYYDKSHKKPKKRLMQYEIQEPEYCGLDIRGEQTACNLF